MKLVRFQDVSGRIYYGEKVNEHSARVISGNIFGNYTVTDDVVFVHKLLAPVEPKTILCIGLNYRQHAEETGVKIPDYPVLFIKAANALNRHGREMEFDVEGFYARVIQHEVDHLQGQVFLDRLSDLNTLTYLREYEEYWKSS